MDIRFLCKRIDAQLTKWLQYLQVQPDYIPAIRAAYTDEIAMKMGHLQPNRRQEMVHRVVVNQKGQIIDVEWLPPFGYLQAVSARITGETTCLSAISVVKSSNRSPQVHLFVN